MKTLFLEILFILLVLTFSFLIASEFDVLEIILDLSRQYENYEMDEIISTLLVASVCLAIFSARRILDLKKSLRKIEETNKELRKTRIELKRLEGIITICSHCKSIRDYQGAWHQLERYISENSDARFSHGICDNCLTKHYQH